MTSSCYARLRGLLDAVPDDQMGARVGEEGLTACDQFFHSCGADVHYMNVIDEGCRRLTRPPADKAAILEMLQQTEAEVVTALEGMSADDLRSKREVKWWDRRGSCLRILLHMIGHKYYHIGQLHSVLQTLQDE